MASILFSCYYFVPGSFSPNSPLTMEVLTRTGRRIIIHDVSNFSLVSVG
ncbi:unnamed protein product [Brassica rapa]|uniref:Uncharacterized protein n=1 Tax=Brassica campestris TaxID=3711 RepID=A0A8D9GH97_BRACM|nr:unnamed protein product [Brassica rapa]